MRPRRWDLPTDATRSTPVDPVVGGRSPRPLSHYQPGDTIPVTWTHSGAVSAETVEIYAVPVPAARMPRDGVAASPRDLDREYEAGASIRVVAWDARVKRGGVKGGWVVPDGMKSGTYRFRAYPDNMYPAWSPSFTIKGCEQQDHKSLFAKRLRLFAVAALLAVLAAAVTVAALAKIKAKRLPRANVLDAQVAVVVPARVSANDKAVYASSSNDALKVSPPAPVEEDHVDIVVDDKVVQSFEPEPAPDSAVQRLQLEAPPALPKPLRLLEAPPQIDQSTLLLEAPPPAQDDADEYL